MKQVKFLALILASVLTITSCDKDDKYIEPQPEPLPQATVVKASGDLTTALVDFRHLLGDSLNTTLGKTSGRREVNWEGVTSTLNNSDAFPFNFFNPTGD